MSFLPPVADVANNENIITDTVHCQVSGHSDGIYNGKVIFIEFISAGGFDLSYDRNSCICKLNDNYRILYKIRFYKISGYFFCHLFSGQSSNMYFTQYRKIYIT